MFGRDLEGKAEEWLAVRESEQLRPATIRAYSDHIHIFLLWLGDRELSPFTFAAFFRDYAKNHSPASCRTIYTSMRAFLRGIGEGNLIGTMRRPRGDVPPKNAYTEGQMRALFSVLRGDRSPTGLRDHAIVCILRYCGLRASEVCGLTVDDIKEEDTVVVRGGKSRFARRDVPVARETPRALGAYLAHGRPKMLRGHSDALFLTVEGHQLTRDALRTMLRRRGDQAGFALSAHRFRHTWATAHVRARTSPTAIGQLAGWSPKTLYDMMANYAHPDLEDLREAQREAFGG